MGWKELLHYPWRLAEERGRREAVEAALITERLQRQVAERALRKSQRENNQGATPAEQQEPSIRAVIGRPQDILALLTLLGALVYGILRMSYERFYQSFGLTPEEVGLDYATVLSHAAVGVLLLVLAGMFWSAIILLLGVDAPNVTGYGPTFLRGLLLIGGYLLGLWINGLSVRDHLPMSGPGLSVIDMLIISLCVGLAAGIFTFLQLNSSFPPLSRLIRGSSWAGVGGLLLVRLLLIALVLLGLIFVPRWIGDRIAKEVKGGALASTGRNSGIKLLMNIQASPVEVSWIRGAPPKPFSPSSQFLLLGQTEGGFVLFEPSTQLVYRVSSDAIVARSQA